MGRKYLRSFKLNNKNSDKMNWQLLKHFGVLEKVKHLVAMELFFYIYMQAMMTHHLLLWMKGMLSFTVLNGDKITENTQRTQTCQQWNGNTETLYPNTVTMTFQQHELE